MSCLKSFHKIKDAYVKIIGIPTHIITSGGWIEDPLDNVKEIAICITGNPGAPNFYTEFIAALHERLDCKLPVWVIGHLGHDDPPTTHTDKVPDLNGHEHSFDLDAQIKHKIQFIEKYVPKDTKIHLIGHSIGSWMILQLLQESVIVSRIKKCYLLFPTIEQMKETPNGQKFTQLAMPLYKYFWFLIPVFNFLPRFIREFILSGIFSVPSLAAAPALQCAESAVIEKIVYLAKDEMNRVRELPKEIIEKYQELLILYYGTTDGWVPTSYYQKLKEQFPAIEAILDERKLNHAFVLQHSQEMAEIVSDMIRKHSELL